MRIVFLFIISLSSLANFSGRWSGAGFFESDRRVGQCKEIFMHFKQTKNKFMILDGGYICGEIQAQYPPSSFDIVEGELFYGGRPVGIISKNKFMISYLDGEFTLSLEKTEGTLNYLEEWRAGEDFLTINSKLDSY